jgi:hypothetical protein
VADRSLAATAIAFGTPVFHGSGPGYALSFHPDAEVVRAVRHALGRPASWVPAVTTTRSLLPAFLAATLDRAGIALLATTRPYATCPTTGTRGPVLERVADVQRTFGRMRPGAVVLAHRSEW